MANEFNTWKSKVDGSQIGVPAGSFTDEACARDNNYELVTPATAPAKKPAAKKPAE